MSEAKVQCRALTARGSPCSRPAGATGYCWQHSQGAPAQRREVAAKGSPAANSAAKAAAKQDRAGPLPAGNHKHLCKGSTAKGEPCSRPAGTSGYCWQHSEQAQSGAASPAASSAAGPAGESRVARPPSSKPLCKGLTDRGSPCSRPAGTSGYCWQHSEQGTEAAGGTSSGSSSCEVTGGNLGAGEQTCRGVTAKGDPCSRPAAASGYCWQHAEQTGQTGGIRTGGKSGVGSASGSASGGGSSSGGSGSGGGGAVPGKLPIQPATSSSPSTSSSGKQTCKGSTAKGEPCSRPAGGSGYCWQHGEGEAVPGVLQEASTSSGSIGAGSNGSSSNNVSSSAGAKPAATPPAAGGHRPATRTDASPAMGNRACLATGADGQPCGRAAGLRGYCSCHIRSGPGGFKDLHATPAFFIDTRRCANINGTTEDTGQWLEWWARVTGREKELAQCCVEGCPARHSAEERLCGGHLWLWGNDGRVDKQAAYIAPLCKLHNSREFDYPKAGFLTRRNTAMLRMLPHECYEDFAVDYQLPAALLGA